MNIAEQGYPRIQDTSETMTLSLGRCQDSEEASEEGSKKREEPEEEVSLTFSSARRLAGSSSERLRGAHEMEKVIRGDTYGSNLDE